MLRNVLIGAVTSAGLHVAVGWEWTIAAAILAGVLSIRRGWLAGAFALAAAWGSVLLGSYLMAPGASSILLGVIGGLISGNTIPAVAVASTLIFGGLLGLAGGAIGGQLRAMATATAE